MALLLLTFLCLCAISAQSSSKCLEVMITVMVVVLLASHRYIGHIDSSKTIDFELFLWFGFWILELDFGLGEKTCSFSQNMPSLRRI